MSKKRIICLIVIGVMLSSVSVLATYLIESSDVEFDNTTANIPDANGDETVSVQEAIDYLFNNMSSVGSTSYTITYNAQDGTENTTDTSEVIPSSNRYGNLPTPIKSGYIFLGWYDAAEGGNKITSDTIIYEDKTVYAHWYQLSSQPLGTTKNGYTYFSTPVTVYYNPIEKSVCEGYINSQSEVGVTAGCMKWYAYSIKDGIVNMILDHNINKPIIESTVFANSYDYGNSSGLGLLLGVSEMCSTTYTNSSNNGSTCRGPLTALKYLKLYTDSWTTTVEGTSATFVASGTGTTYTINYSIDYDSDGVKDYKARLITAKEVANIADKSFTESSSSNITDLPDFLKENLESSIGLRGYWTSSSSDTGNAWGVFSSGWLYRYYPSYTGYGIRPVITVQASEIFS